MHEVKSIHPQEPLNGIMIDCNIVDLIQALWDAGFVTNSCCESCPDDQIWLSFTTSEDLLFFVGILLDVGEFYVDGQCIFTNVRRSGSHYCVHFPFIWKQDIIKKLKEEL